MIFVIHNEKDKKVVTATADISALTSVAERNDILDHTVITILVDLQIIK